MGIWQTLFNKHGGKKSKEIQELLEVIKEMEDNETLLLKQNASLLADLEKCIASQTPAHKIALVLTFNHN